jgi:hypothetical protein
MTSCLMGIEGYLDQLVLVDLAHVLQHNGLDGDLRACDHDILGQKWVLEIIL